MFVWSYPQARTNTWPNNSWVVVGVVMVAVVMVPSSPCVGYLWICFQVLRCLMLFTVDTETL